jgi:hypothetical protein
LMVSGYAGRRATRLTLGRNRVLLLLEMREDGAGTKLKVRMPRATMMPEAAGVGCSMEL